MALVREIPVIIFEHEQVDLKGLPQECFCVEFNDPNSDDFEQAFNEVMLWVRQTIRENKQDEFIKTVLKVGGAMSVGALLAAGLGSETKGEVELEE